MGIFRRSTIFHAEDALPDPEDLKLRFRRRVLLITLLAFLGVLGAPVVRDLQPYLRGRSEARRFALAMLEARTLAASSRMPVGLELGKDGQSWLRKAYQTADNCEKEAPAPVSLMASEGISWKLQAQQENGEAFSGTRLCWHPQKGLLLHTVPLANAKLLVSLAGKDETGAELSLAQLLVTKGGAEMETIAHQ